MVGSRLAIPEKGLTRGAVDRARVFALRFMTHAEYDLNRWKEQL